MKVTVTVDESVVCNVCGEKSTYDVNIDTYGDPEIAVDPCKNCLDQAKNDSYSEGFADGQESD